MEKIPYIKFYVLGSNPPEEIKKLASSRVIIKGFVSDNELEEFYHTTKISVVPLRYGAGIKGKVVEAMKYGIPVVTTSVGAEGIVGSEQILCIADETKEFAQKLVELYENKKRLEKMAAESYNYIEQNFAPSSALQVIAEDFEIGEKEI